VKAQYAEHPALITDMTTKTKAAEQLWTKLRDADCAVETFGTEKGKEFEIAQNTCLAQRSDDRSEYLQSLLAEQ
jgi:uncharacterized protein YecT (DUF1311 family)